MSLFIVFEGGEGSGKSTQCHLLATALKERGIPFILTHEPGDTEVGVELRKILLDRNRAPLSAKTEALLFAADRSEHVDNVIRPALARGEVVICDRYIASSVAYQAYAGGLPKDTIRSLSEWATNSLYPDVVFYMDLSPEIGLKRVSDARMTHFEDKGLEFHRRVKDGFDDQYSATWVQMDGRDSAEALAGRILEHTLHMIKLKEEARRVMEEVFTRSVTNANDIMQQLGFSEEERNHFLLRAKALRKEV
jgi:dTMP kinase